MSYESYEWKGYIIEKKCIGKGMYSKVYHGYDKKTGKEIALKKIYFDKLESKVKERVITEINILEKLDHQNIIKLYDYKFDGEYILLIMEYCKDKDLSRWLEESHTEEEITSVIKQILEGMKYLHKNNIIHRDIKPDNILIHNNTIKLCDFGFSKIIKNDLELFDTMCGTPLFMSPEILFIQPYNIKSDIWSLGILFYKILCGKHPFGILENLEHYRNKIKDNFIIEFNDIYNKYKEEFILKIIPIIKDMLHYSYEKRPSINDIMNIINNNKQSPYISSIQFNTENNNPLLDLSCLVSPTPFSPISFHNTPNNSYNTPYRKQSIDHYNDKINELENKLKSLETRIKNFESLKDNSFSLDDVDDDYFKEEYKEIKEIKRSNPVNINKKSIVGTIYDYISKSF